MSAADIIHLHTHSPNVPQKAPPRILPPETLAIVARNNVTLLSHHQRPTVSTPINVAELQRELCTHPDHNFVNSLLNALRYSTRIGYLGPQKARVLHNPKVVSANLDKGISLKRVVGPFPSFQCHPVWVVSKKHSSAWRTIYHLFYPEGDSINDYVTKDLYSLQYVLVDNTIIALQSLGQGSYMAKTDLKSTLQWPLHFQPVI